MRPVDINITINGKAIALAGIGVLVGLWMKKSGYLNKIFAKM